MRGLAILLVISVHYVVLPEIASQPAWILPYLQKLFAQAWSGVDLFFVLSGFLIGGILLDHRHSRSYFSTFYLRRFWRIIPLYAVVCALFIAGLMLSVPERWPRLQWLYGAPVPVWALLSFTQNFWLAGQPVSPFMGVTWSLAVEEHFYLTLPLLIRFVSPRRLPIVLAVIIVLTPVLRYAVVGLWPRLPMAAYMYTFCRADALAWGVLAALAVRNPAWRALIAARRPWLYAAFAVLLAGVGVMTQYGIKTHRFTPLLAAGVYSWMALFYCCLLLLAVTAPSGAVARVLRVRPLQSLGIVAYGAYLFHLPLLFACFGLFLGTAPRLVTPADFAVALFALALSIALAHASWNFLEKPLLRRGHAHRY